MEELVKSITNKTKFIAVFNWSEMEEVPMISSYTAHFNRFGNEIITDEYGYSEEDYDDLMGLSGVTKELANVLYVSEKEISKSETFEGIGTTAVGGNCLFEIAFMEKSAILDIHGKKIPFICSKKENKDDDHTIVLFMEPVLNELGFKDFIYFRTEESVKLYEKLEKEVREKNKPIRKKIKEEAQKKMNEIVRLQEEYKSFDGLKKFFGGETLKKRHYIK